MLFVLEPLLAVRKERPNAKRKKISVKKNGNNSANLYHYGPDLEEEKLSVSKNRNDFDEQNDHSVA